MTKAWTIGLSLAAALHILACNASDDDDEKVEGVSEALEQGGGCSMTEIKDLKRKCAARCAARGVVSKGVKSCSKYTGLFECACGTAKASPNTPKEDYDDCRPRCADPPP